MPPTSLSPYEMVKIFVIFGPMPVALLASVTATLVSFNLFFGFLALIAIYVLSFIPAALTGFIFGLLYKNINVKNINILILLCSLKGAMLGLVTGCLSYLSIYIISGTNSLPHLILLAVLGFLGGAVSGARIAYLTLHMQ